jgi:flagellum-specific peptidoglycan hydrolase FlgJ
MNIINNIGLQVYELLIEYGFNFKQAQYITAQAAHETGNFSSKIFLENKNLFGYKYIGQKNAKGEKNGHANYESIEHSIQDYKVYYTARKYPSLFSSVVEFVKTLKRNNYFEAPEKEYLKGIKHFLRLYFGTQ